MKTTELNFHLTVVLGAILSTQLTALICVDVRGQTYTLDPSFHPLITTRGGFSASAIQPDGKLIVGGYWEFISGTPQPNPRNLVRLNSDGTRDTGFAATAGYPSSLVLQPDGKIIVNQGYTIVRLNRDGSLDETFTYVSNAQTILALALQADGRLVIGGHENEAVNGMQQRQPFLSRLGSGGRLDATFKPVLRFTTVGLAGYGVRAIAIERDGKMLIGGDIDSVNGAARRRIARLSSNGVLESAFNPVLDSGQNHASIDSLIVRDDGKIVVVGRFNLVNGVNLTNLARLNPDGGLEGAFKPQSYPNTAKTWEPGIRSVSLQSDGKLIITRYVFPECYPDCSPDIPDWVITRLNADGSLDAGFEPRTIPLDESPGWDNSEPKLIGVQADGKVLIGVNGQIERLNADGKLETVLPARFERQGAVGNLAQQPDGKVIISGNFDWISETGRRGFARLNTDGTLDTTFDPVRVPANEPSRRRSIEPRSWREGWHRLCVLQDDGKIILPVVSSRNGISLTNVVRLNPNGSVDTDFIPVLTGPNVAAEIQDFVLMNGKLVIASVFNEDDGTIVNKLVRLNPNGSLDAGFRATVRIPTVDHMAVQPDGKLVVAGSGEVSRLNTDGTLDSSFNPALQWTTDVDASYVSALAVQPDGKNIIARISKSRFGTIGGIAPLIGEIARLNADGSLDASFDSGGIRFVDTLASQPDGTVIITGHFEAGLGIVRLNADGRLDKTFQLDSNGWVGFASTTPAVAQPDGSLLFGSSFVVSGGFPWEFTGALSPYRFGMFRFIDAPLLRTPLFTSNGKFSVILEGKPARKYRVEASTDLMSWLLLTNFSSMAASTPIIDSKTADFPRRFYRTRLVKP